MDDTGGFSESVEVPLKNSVTIVVEDCNGCCRLTESGFPLGCLREQECHEFWNFATEKKLISSICSIFENTCRQLVKEVKEGTASTKEKNELINFLCRTGAVRLKFTDLATIINQRRKGVARRSVTTPESSANSTISREPTPQTYETQPHPQQACQWAVVQESNYQPTQRSDPEYRGVEVQQSLAAPSFAEMSRLPPAAIEAGPSQLTLIRKYLISAKQDEQDKPSKEDDVFNEEDEEEDVSDDEIMENCNCDDEDETVGQKRKFPGSRFAQPVTDNEVQARAVSAQNSAIPIHTLRRNRWAVRLFYTWAAVRKGRGLDSSDLNVDKALKDMDDKELSYWLSRFILEVRKTNGDEYPAKTLFCIIMGIQSHIRIETGKTLSVIEQQEYEPFRQVLESEMKRLNEKGVGLETKHPEIELITPKDEDWLWECKLLGEHNPYVLLNTMVFLNGKHFGLRNGKEHRNIRYYPSQISLHERKGHISCLHYEDESARANKAGVKHRKARRKEVVIYEDSESPERCHVRLYKKYLSLCPNTSQRDYGAFYLQPLRNPNDKVWYSVQPVGHNALHQVVPDLFKALGKSTFKANHALGATMDNGNKPAGAIKQEPILID
ncbi:uncharacterized protein KIAA1958-like isoform X1 [Ptychodera flava]|uniref:uncharacterized protein KIAA1958-like isoform X1 n=1 Tax=Ptychodera flava TaxID=63121 RepID=UPI00396A4C7B